MNQVNDLTNQIKALKKTMKDSEQQYVEASKDLPKDQKELLDKMMNDAKSGKLKLQDLPNRINEISNFLK